VRKPLALAALVLALSTSTHAGPLNMRWGACFGDGGTFNRSFACDTNSGFDELVCSFVPPGLILGAVQTEAVVRFAFAGSSIPPWWQFTSPGSCRPTSMAVLTTAPSAAIACVDFAEGRNTLVSYGTSFWPNLADLHVLSPTFPAGPFDLQPGQEYFLLTVRINHLKTVGTGSCSGCSLGACMGLVGLKLVLPTLPYPIQLYPTYPNDQVSAWQGGAGIGTPNYGGTGQFYCPGATPTHRSTWGDVKALYR
jgi:hypothetical protein